MKANFRSSDIIGKKDRRQVDDTEEVLLKFKNRKHGTEKKETGNPNTENLNMNGVKEKASEEAFLIKCRVTEQVNRGIIGEDK